MKRFISYIILFVVAVVVIDQMVGYLSDYMVVHARSGSVKQLYDLCENNHYDMLVMGSSKAHHNYIPQVFSDSLGMSCYNAGYDGEGIILAYGILSLIDDDRLPELIVYDAKLQFDLYQIDQDGDHTRYYSKLRPFYGRPEIGGIIRDISRIDYMKLHSGLYRTNGKLPGIISSFIRGSKEDPNNGFESAAGILNDSNVAERDYQLVVDSLKVRYLCKFVKLANEKNVRLIVVFSPEFNTPYAADYQIIRDICTASGVTVLDYFDSPEYQDIGLFTDHCHMNEKGARTFSMQLASAINKERFRIKQF